MIRIKLFIKRKRYTGRLRGRVTELHLCGSLNYFYGASCGFLWPIIFICLVHSLYLVYLRIFPCVHMQLLAKMNFTGRGLGRTSLGIIPL